MGSTAAGPEPLLKQRWQEIAAFALIAQAPDLDFVPGLLMGQPALFHHGVSHSLGAAVIAGVLAAVLAGLLARSFDGLKGKAWRWGLVIFLIYLAQVGLDALNADTSEPYGVPLWWPFSGEYVMADPPLFLDVRRHPLAWATVWHNLKQLGLELLLIGPFTALAMWWRRRRLLALTR